MAVLAIVGTLAAPANAATGTTGSRAMWLWTKPAPADVVAWARAHGVG